MNGRTSFDISLCVLSWQQRRTLICTLQSLRHEDVLGLFAERILFFNEIEEEDQEVAVKFGFTAIGSDKNIGIFGGMRGLAEKARSTYVLFLENDCPLIASRAELVAMIDGALADMKEHQAPVFSMRSRRYPGEKCDRRARYEKRFQVVQPLGTSTPPRRPSFWRRKYEDLRKPHLIGCAIFAEERPDLRHPKAIKRTANGNWLTSSRYLNWSNNCLLVRREVLIGTIIERVRAYPSPTTVNGHQDVEAALKLAGWWRRQNVPMGQSEPGAFTHHRLG